MVLEWWNFLHHGQVLAAATSNEGKGVIQRDDDFQRRADDSGDLDRQDRLIDPGADPQSR